jgi:4-amino-4-deoxy-L-arabinose transferase-like glycosyltransferase
MVSWLGHFLCIIAVAVMGRRLLRENLAPGLGQFYFWLPVIGMTLDPFMIFLGRKLWIDSLLAGLCAAAMAFYFCARYSERRTLYLMAGGVMFGLAGLAKLPALALGPVMLWLILTPEGVRARPLRDVCLGFLPALFLLLPWFALFYHTYGVLLPSWTKPDEWTMSRYPLVRAAVERTPLYYAGKLAAVQPMILPCLVMYMVRKTVWKNVASAMPCAWFLIVFLAISYVGWSGQGYQSRFLAPLFPAVYLMVYALMNEWRARWNFAWATAVLLVFLYAGINGSLYLLLPQYDEIRPALAVWNWGNL